jgi:hypothetical protein
MTLDYGPDGSCWLRCEAKGCHNAAGAGDLCDVHRPKATAVIPPALTARWADPLPLVVRVVDKKQGGGPDALFLSNDPPWFQVWLHPEGWDSDVKIAVAVSEAQYSSLDVGSTFRLYQDKP